MHANIHTHSHTVASIWENLHAQAKLQHEAENEQPTNGAEACNICIPMGESKNMHMQVSGHAYIQMSRTKTTTTKNLKPIRQRATLKSPSLRDFQQEQSQAKNVRRVKEKKYWRKICK